MNELKHKCCMVSEESERLLFSYGTIVNLDCFIMHGSDSNQGTDYIAIWGGGGFLVVKSLKNLKGLIARDIDFILFFNISTNIFQERLWPGVSHTFKKAKWQCSQYLDLNPLCVMFTITLPGGFHQRGCLNLRHNWQNMYYLQQITKHKQGQPPCHQGFESIVIIDNTGKPRILFTSNWTRSMGFPPSEEIFILVILNSVFFYSAFFLVHKYNSKIFFIHL